MYFRLPTIESQYEENIMVDVSDMPATQVPITGVFEKIVDAAKYSVCEVDGVQMSSYRFMEDMANNPDKYTAEWKQSLLVAGIGGVGSTVALPAIIIASGPLAPITLVGAMIAAPFFGGNRACTIVIANGLMGNLKKSEIYQDCGVQTGRPVYSETDPESGVVQSTNADVIPGINVDMPEFPMAGIGMYRFEKDRSLVIGFYGTGGAISFTNDDPKYNQKKIAVAWLVPETGKPAFAVTGDLSKYQSLKAFYDKTAGARDSTQNRDLNGGRPSVYGSMSFRRYPDEQNVNDLVLTVFVRQ
jgi:hypothetical protein